MLSDNVERFTRTSIMFIEEQRLIGIKASINEAVGCYREHASESALYIMLFRINCMTMTRFFYVFSRYGECMKIDNKLIMKFINETFQNNYPSPI